MDLPARPHPAGLSRSALLLLFYGALSVLAVGWGALRGDADIYRLREGVPPLQMALSPLVGAAVGLALAFLSRLAVHRFDWARRLHRDFRHLLGPLAAREILVLALASSVGEELVFRGALLPAAGLLLSSAIFAGLHVGPGLRFLPWTLQALAVGLLMAGLATWMGDLGAPIAAHFTINFVNLRFIVHHDLPV